MSSNNSALTSDLPCVIKCPVICEVTVCSWSWVAFPKNAIIDNNSANTAEVTDMRILFIFTLLITPACYGFDKGDLAAGLIIADWAQTHIYMDEHGELNPLITNKTELAIAQTATLVTHYLLQGTKDENLWNNSVLAIKGVAVINNAIVISGSF